MPSKPTKIRALLHQILTTKFHSTHHRNTHFTADTCHSRISSVNIDPKIRAVIIKFSSPDFIKRLKNFLHCGSLSTITLENQSYHVFTPSNPLASAHELSSQSRFLQAKATLSSIDSPVENALSKMVADNELLFTGV